MPTVIKIRLDDAAKKRFVQHVDTLRAEGLTWRVIACRLGYANYLGARVAYMRIIGRRKN